MQNRITGPRLLSLALLALPVSVQAQEADSLTIETLLDSVASFPRLASGTTEELRLEPNPVLIETGGGYRALRYTAEPGLNRIFLSGSGQTDPVLFALGVDTDFFEFNDDSPFGGLDSFVEFQVHESTDMLLVATSFNAGTVEVSLRADHDPTALPTTRALASGPVTSRRDFVARVSRRRQMAFREPIGFQCKRRPEEGPSESGRPVHTVSDPSHPRRFTSVIEITDEGDSLMAFDRGSSETRRDVDRGSDLIVRFNPDWFLTGPGRTSDAAISITAQLVGSDGSRNLEVTGYSLVGARQRRAAVRLKSVERWESLVCPVVEEWQQTGSYLHAALLEDIDAPSAFYKETVIGRLTVQRAPLATLIDALLAENNQSLLRGAALIVERDWESSKALAEDLRDQLDSILANPDSLVSDAELQAFIEGFTSLQRRLRALATDLISATEGSRASLLQGLKDGEITLSEAGARPGDRLLIRVENDAQEDSLPSTMILTLTVRRFGLRTSIGDASTLLQRDGLSDSELSELKNRLALRDSPTDTVVPLPSRFAPVTGVTMGWHWYPRREGALGDILRWLHPGVGISVLFPRYSRRHLTTVEGSGEELVVNETDETDVINLGAGPVVTFFNNALQLSAGWNLSVEEERFYWGLGFSFGRVPDLVGAAFGGAQAGTDPG